MQENCWNEQQIKENIARIRENIRRAAQEAGTAPEQIRLMAVTKTVPAEFVNLASEQGITLFGENRAQELCGKYEQYRFGAEQIHFIGTLQSNKVRQIVDKVSCIESVDSLSLAEEISRRAGQHGKTMDVCLEVNIGREPSKGGLEPEKVLETAEKLSVLPNLRLRGLMCIPPAGQPEAVSAQYFDAVREIFVDIHNKKMDNVCMEYLSMGMSSDYELAIRHGANLVRIGTAMFGRRAYPGHPVL